MLEEPGFVEQMSQAFADLGGAMGGDAMSKIGAAIGEGEAAAGGATAAKDAPSAENDSE